jgi:hypothetical protein
VTFSQMLALEPIQKTMSRAQVCGVCQQQRP